MPRQVKRIIGSTFPHLPVLMLILLPGFVLMKGSASHPAAPLNLASQLQEEQLRAGDLIFRKGISLVSRLVQVADQQTVYTHVGIIVDYEGEKRVVHAVPAEEPDGIDRVKMESLTEFLQPGRAVELGIYRYKGAAGPDPADAARWAVGKALAAVPFDKSFDLQDNAALYCTELIWKAYLEAGIDLCEGEFDRLPLSLRQEHYILPGRIISNTHLTPIIHLPKTTDL